MFLADEGVMIEGFGGDFFLLVFIKHCWNSENSSMIQQKKKLSGKEPFVMVLKISTTDHDDRDLGCCFSLFAPILTLHKCSDIFSRSQFTIRNEKNLGKCKLLLNLSQRSLESSHNKVATQVA